MSAHSALRTPHSALLGASLPRPDALGKVTGAARYPGDLIRAGMLHIKVIFSGRPHARILSIDTSAALSMPGVVTVLTAADVPFNAFGLIDADQPVLCVDVVRFEFDLVAALMAESGEVAEAAAKMVKVVYEDLPAILDTEAALHDSPGRVHADLPNLMLHVPIHRGDVDAAFAEADVIVAVGRGLKSDKDLPMIQEFADAIGAELACTRPCIEAGWFDPRRQIGLSGRTVKPQIIIALGISGSVQFAAGMQNSDFIIAVNSDPKASIFNIAHAGIVGDLYEILPELMTMIGSNCAESEVV